MLLEGNQDVFPAKIQRLFQVGEVELSRSVGAAEHQEESMGLRTMSEEKAADALDGGLDLVNRTLESEAS